MESDLELLEFSRSLKQISKDLQNLKIGFKTNELVNLVTSFYSEISFKSKTIEEGKRKGEIVQQGYLRTISSIYILEKINIYKTLNKSFDFINDDEFSSQFEIVNEILIILFYHLVKRKINIILSPGY